MSAELRLDELFWGGFRLYQNPDWFCFGDDSVLLADFAAPRPHDRLLDMGCGNGVLCLLLAAKEPTLELSAIELMAENVALARRNLDLNGLTATVLHGDMHDRANYPMAAQYDYIVMNPPYRRAGSGKACHDPVRQAARYESCGTLADSLATAAALLTPAGALALVLPQARAEELTAAAHSAGLQPLRQRAVIPRRGDPPHLLLIEYGLTAATCRDLPTLAIREADGRKSAAMERIRRAYEPQ